MAWPLLDHGAGELWKNQKDCKNTATDAGSSAFCCRRKRLQRQSSVVEVDQPAEIPERRLFVQPDNARREPPLADMEVADHYLNHSCLLQKMSPEVEELDQMIRHKRFDVNVYATKKSAANGLMDLALLMANASQLKHIMMSGNFGNIFLNYKIVFRKDGQSRFYYLMLTLIGSSIVLQIAIGVALLFLSRMRIAYDNYDDEVILKDNHHFNHICISLSDDRKNATSQSHEQPGRRGNTRAHHSQRVHIGIWIRRYEESMMINIQ
jgi:hypothetical protein